MARLTVALERYDRHIPLFLGQVPMPGFEYEAFEVGQSAESARGSGRHERMLHDGEFDVAELSLSSYLVARDQSLPFTAIPVFPRRLFSQSQIWVNTQAGINGPRDLEGRRVGLSTYQTTLSVLAKGDLAQVYGIDWTSITWVTTREESLAVALPTSVKLEQVATGSNVTQALLEGSVDALIIPHPSRAILESPGRVRRLFPDPRAEEQRYVRQRGYFPIMHLVAARDDIFEQHAGLPMALFNTFNEALAASRHFYEDPNWSLLAWGRHAVESEEAFFGETDPWRNGVQANRRNLECFIDYSLEQGLISRRLNVDELFHPSTVGT